MVKIFTGLSEALIFFIYQIANPPFSPFQPINGEICYPTGAGSGHLRLKNAPDSQTGHELRKSKKN